MNQQDALLFQSTTHDFTNCCLYRVDPPDDEQQTYSKHVEAYYLKELKVNSASCWLFILYIYIYQSRYRPG